MKMRVLVAPRYSKKLDTPPPRRKHTSDLRGVTISFCGATRALIKHGFGMRKIPLRYSACIFSA